MTDLNIDDPGDCAQAHRRLGTLVAQRLRETETRIGEAFAAQATLGGITGGAGPLTESIELARYAARLRSAAGVLDSTPAGSGGCTDDCACTRAAVANGEVYAFAAGTPVACTLDAEGGDLTVRLGEWQAVLSTATGREEVDDGIALTFPHDAARTVELARLLAAEYACCSFARYALLLDDRGVRVEVRTPPEARAALAAVFGRP
jgi:hypothetical protein